MTIKKFVDQVFSIYQQNKNLFIEGAHNPLSPQKAAVQELRRAATVLLEDDSTKKRQEVEGALYLCESLGVLSTKESEQLVDELYKAK